MPNKSNSKHGAIANARTIKHPRDVILGCRFRDSQMLCDFWTLISLYDPFCYLPLTRRKFGAEAHYWNDAPQAAVVVLPVTPGNGQSGVLPTVSLSKIADDPVVLLPMTVPLAPGP